MATRLVEIHGNDLYYEDYSEVGHLLTGTVVEGSMTPRLKVKGDYLRYRDHSDVVRQLLGTVTEYDWGGNLKNKTDLLCYKSHSGVWRCIALTTTYLWTTPTNDLRGRDPDSYNTAHEQASADTIVWGDANPINSWNVNLTPDQYEIYRSCVSFDTSTIPAEATITSAYFKGYIATKIQTDDGHSDLYIVEGAYTVPDIELSDYGVQGGKTTSGGMLAFADMVQGEYNLVELNETGRGWITKAGLTKLGLRLKGDIDKSIPTGINRVGIRKDHVDTPAVLVITYS